MEPRSLGPVLIPFTVWCITYLYFQRKSTKFYYQRMCYLAITQMSHILMQKYIAFGNNVSLMYSYSVWVRENTLQVFTWNFSVIAHREHLKKVWFLNWNAILKLSTPKACWIKEDRFSCESHHVHLTKILQFSSLIFFKRWNIEYAPEPGIIIIHIVDSISAFPISLLDKTWIIILMIVLFIVVFFLPKMFIYKKQHFKLLGYFFYKYLWIVYSSYILFCNLHFFHQ